MLYQPRGVLTVKTEISDYVYNLKTLEGKHNTIRFDPKLCSIMAKSVVSYHLFRLFQPLGYTGIYQVVTGILDNLRIEHIILNEDTIDLICIMLKNEIKKVCTYVFNTYDYDTAKLGVQAIIDTIKIDLTYLAN